jgi:hypothetical protein
MMQKTNAIGDHSIKDAQLSKEAFFSTHTMGKKPGKP